VAGGVATRGADGFNSYYAELFGWRWPNLEAALRASPRRVLRLNAFASREAQERASSNLRAAPGLPGCFELSDSGWGAERCATSGLAAGYVMDGASVLAARALAVQPGETVLDLCAAPGGKALVLLEAVGPQGSLTLNDRSPRRSARLRAVLTGHVPRELVGKVRLTTRDAKRWGLHEPDSYDAVLLDAPCSSERHVLGDARELAKWSRSRVRRLAADQHALLAAAATSLKPGGRLVYCTCALAPAENDGVIERLLRKGRHRLQVVGGSASLGEATRHGWQLHPDRHGYGPMYFSTLVRA